jgi:membrane protein
MLGLLAIVSTAVAGFVTGGATHGVLATVGGILVAFAVNLVLFFAAFRLLTRPEIETDDLVPGVILAAVLWQIISHLGGIYVDHVVRHAKETSGLFAVVLGLLAWLYLGGQVTLIAAEVNVVRARKLWPRSFFSEPLLDADRRALTLAAEVEERLHQQNVEVDFDGSPSGSREG